MKDEKRSSTMAGWRAALDRNHRAMVPHLHQASPAISAIDQAENLAHERTLRSLAGILGRHCFRPTASTRQCGFVARANGFVAHPADALALARRFGSQAGRHAGYCGPVKRDAGAAVAFIAAAVPNYAAAAVPGAARRMRRWGRTWRRRNRDLHLSV
jgi:hypothetical protein